MTIYVRLSESEISLEMRWNFKPASVSLIDRIISELAQEGFEVSQLCDALEVSRSAFYAVHFTIKNRISPTPISSKITSFSHGSSEFSISTEDGTAQDELRTNFSHEKPLAVELKHVKSMGQMSLVAIQPKSFKPRTTESRHTK